MTNVNEEIELYDLDSEIEDSGYYLATEGIHEFQVVGINKSKYEPKPGSKSRIPAGCWQIEVICQLTDTPEPVRVSSKLFLTSLTKGLLVRFFESIGMMKKGDKLRLNWNVTGKTGYLDLNHREYNGNEYNNIKSFVSQEDKKVIAYKASRESASMASSSGWKAGTF